MKRILSTALLAIAAVIFSCFAARHAAAIELTLNLVPSSSVVTVSGSFSGAQFSPQDTAPPLAGITDQNAAMNSMTTTFGGTITVDVDNVNNPSSIQILSSAAAADSGGLWLTRVFPVQDIGGDDVLIDEDNPPDGNPDEGPPGLPDGQCCEFGLGKDGDSDPAEANPPGPAVAGDWGLRIRHPSFGVLLALASARDIVFNVTSPVEPVVAGTFNSTNENIEFADGWLDYWVAQGAGGLQGRAELAGGDDENAADSVLSSYTVTPLPGNQRLITLTIPVNVDGDPTDDAVFNYTGSLVATYQVPEPSTFVLTGLAMAFASAFAARRRK
jgi:hypothetical protein